MTHLILTWIGIILCIAHAGMFSGLNLAMLGISRLRLEVQARLGNPGAQQLLALRKDAHALLATIVWANVGANVLLTMLSDSVLTGLTAFIFSTFVITFGGEILPQAYFSRYALQIARLLAPILRFYQIMLYPLAKPTAWLLNRWLGPEGIEFYGEVGIREIIRQHAESDLSDVDRIEGQGALNFLAFDDLRVTQEGQPLHPDSVIPLPCQQGQPQFPEVQPHQDDPFVQRVLSSGQRWCIITSPEDEPILALETDDFLRAVVRGQPPIHPEHFCHRPCIVRDPNTLLGRLLSRLEVHPESVEDDIIDHDIILLWSEQRRIITGADVLGRLMRGIVLRQGL